METLKTGFGPQFNGFMQPFDSGLYAGYSSYNQWDHAKIPGPLASKSFPWGLNSVNPLPNVVSNPSGMCFSSPTSAGTSSMPTMQGSAGMSSAGSPPCPYAAPAPPYLYNREQCSSSIATLRLKAKQHSSVTNFAAAAAYPGVPAGRQPALSACQYAAVGQGSAGMV